MKCIVKVLVICMFGSPLFFSALPAMEEVEVVESEETEEVEGEEEEALAEEEVAEEDVASEEEEVEEKTPPEEEAEEEEKKEVEEEKVTEEPEEEEPEEEAEEEEEPPVKKEEVKAEERTFELQEEEPFKIEGDSEERQEWFKEANSHYETIQKIMKEIENSANKLHDIDGVIDPKVDLFNSKINSLFGKIDEKIEQMRNDLCRVEMPATEMTELEKSLETIGDGANQLMRRATEITSLKDLIGELLELVDKYRGRAALSIEKIDDIKPLILQEKKDDDARAHLRDIIRIEEHLTIAKKNVSEIGEKVSEQEVKIKEEMVSVTKKGDNLLDTVIELENQVEEISKAKKKIVASVEEKPEVKEEVGKVEPKKRAVKVTEIKLQWYEKIASSFAQIFIKIRDFIRFVLGIAPSEEEKTEEEEEIKEKMREIKEDKVKLEAKKPDESESIGQLLNKVVMSTFEIVKRAFYGVGYVLNSVLEKLAGAGAREEKVEEEAPAKEPVKEETPVKPVEVEKTPEEEPVKEVPSTEEAEVEEEATEEGEEEPEEVADEEEAEEEEEEEEDEEEPVADLEDEEEEITNEAE